MFEMNPSTPPPTQTPSVMNVFPNKLTPTKPIPTSASNKYAIFTSNHDEDYINENDEGITQPSNVKQAPETGINQNLNTQTMSNTRDGDNDGVDDADVVPVTVHLNLQIKETMHELPTTALDLGSLINSNKNMPEYNEYVDEASQVTVATTKIRRRKSICTRKTHPTRFTR